MKKLIAMTAFLALAVSAGQAADDDAAKAAKKLEGSYTVLEFIFAGKPTKKAEEVKSFVIKDGEFTIDAGMEKDSAKFTLDPSKKPAEIDILPGKGEVVKGIYATKDTDKGLELTLAFAKGKDVERPKDFKGEGESTVVLKLLRKK